MIGLGEELTGRVGQGEIMLALERLGPGIGLVVAGVAGDVTQPAGDVRLGALDVRAQLDGLGLQLVPHLAELGLGPGLLARPDRQRGRSRRRSSGHITPPRCPLTAILLSRAWYRMRVKPGSHRRIGADRSRPQTYRPACVP
jgi:hypothetical protein